jgi:hypothetical protein
MREEDGLEAAAVEVPAAARKVCWNTKCGSSSSSKWRPGWVLRAGNTAYLCDSCGYGDLLTCLLFSSPHASVVSLCLLTEEESRHVGIWCSDGPILVFPFFNLGPTLKLFPSRTELNSRGTVGAGSASFHGAAKMHEVQTE